ncbi:MAG: AAA family ATPase [Sarcina sp.]
MYLKKISIENFKSIENLEINLESGFNLIIGNNGVGKTSILEAISVGISGFIGGIDGVNNENFTIDEIRCETELLGQGSYNIKYRTPVKVECMVELRNEEYTWIRQKKSIKASRTTVEPRDICKKATELSDDSSQVLPVLNYQSVSRMWAQKKEKIKNEFDTKNFSRNIGYIDCLAQESNNKLLLNWCRKMEQISWQEDKKIAEYEVVKNTVAQFMSIMNESHISKVFYDKKREELIYIDENEVLPIRLLSAGYQSLIWMVFEISYRMSVLNPNLLENTNKETDGVVLIDELDLHLHPKWQWKVVAALQSVFPKIQFIATTHSPIIISSCKDERVISLKENSTVTYNKSLYGIGINDVLSEYQGSNSIASGIKKMLEDFYFSMEQNEYSNAKSVLEKLINELGDDNPEVVLANMTYELEATELED